MSPPPGRPKAGSLPQGGPARSAMGAPSSLCLFDLDETLLPLDSDHAWGEFVIRLGWVDEVEFRRRNDEFYAQYQAGVLDIHAYIAFATTPLRERDTATLADAHARFMREVIAPRILPPALELVRMHQAQGDLVGLVTATNDFITAPIAAAFGIEHLIALRLERGPGGTITGGISGVAELPRGQGRTGRRVAAGARPRLWRLRFDQRLQRFAERPAAARAGSPPGGHQPLAGARSAGSGAPMAHSEVV